jgi:hypothetical protein
MTWIRTIPPQEADAALREKYAQLYAAYPAEYRAEVPAVQRPDGTADSIIASHSLIPDAMHHVFAAFAALMSPELPLTRRQHELIAACVSSINRCFY